MHSEVHGITHSRTRPPHKHSTQYGANGFRTTHSVFHIFFQFFFSIFVQCNNTRVVHTYNHQTEHIIRTQKREKEKKKSTSYHTNPFVWWDRLAQLTRLNVCSLLLLLVLFSLISMNFPNLRARMIVEASINIGVRWSIDQYNIITRSDRFVWDPFAVIVCVFPIIFIFEFLFNEFFLFFSFCYLSFSFACCFQVFFW